MKTEICVESVCKEFRAKGSWFCLEHMTKYRIGKEIMLKKSVKAKHPLWANSPYQQELKK